MRRLPNRLELASEKAVQQISWALFEELCREMSARAPTPLTGVYGVPTGGSFVALRLSQILNVPLLEKPKVGCWVVDDLIDSGSTLGHFSDFYRTDTLLRKSVSPASQAPQARAASGWVQFPWEHDSRPVDAARRLSQYTLGRPSKFFERLLLLCCQWARLCRTISS